jgi:hypothetical protein
MLFLGTEKYPEEGSYQKFISEHGGHTNAYTNYENTNYQYDIAAEHLKASLDRFHCVCAQVLVVCVLYVVMFILLIDNTLQICSVLSCSNIYSLCYRTRNECSKLRCVTKLPLVLVVIACCLCLVYDACYEQASIQ